MEAPVDRTIQEVVKLSLTTDHYSLILFSSGFLNSQRLLLLLCSRDTLLLLLFEEVLVHLLSSDDAVGKLANVKGLKDLRPLNLLIKSAKNLFVSQRFRLWRHCLFSLAHQAFGYAAISTTLRTEGDSSRGLVPSHRTNSRGIHRKVHGLDLSPYRALNPRMRNSLVRFRVLF